MSKKTMVITGVGKSTLSSAFNKVITEHPECVVKLQGEGKSFQEHLDEETQKLSGMEKRLIKTQISTVLDYLETAFCGARMMDDVEMMTRLARAIAALEAPTDKDIFTQEFMEEYVTM